MTILRDPRTIRARAESILRSGIAGELEHFEVHLEKLDEVARRVVEVTRARYPDLEIPFHSRWGHFRAGGVDRVAEFDRRVASSDRIEQARCRFDLVTTSVLLDAGAGLEWRYVEPSTGESYSRSEGLAVASFDAFTSGMFSSDPAKALRADAEALSALSEVELAAGLQSRPENPLEGLDGRASLLRSVGDAISAQPERFGESSPRIGNLVDHLISKSDGGPVAAREILLAVLESFGVIWTEGATVDGATLGDVWPHPHAGGEGETRGLVPFHKLAQWLSYSLIEPLQWAGFEVVGVDELTGLAEYRNGGLLVDTGALVVRSDRTMRDEHAPGDEVVVEWRALTVALLDRVAEGVRAALGKSAEELPLAKVLEGGTWRAGREIAAEKRADGGPPIRVRSEGRVF